MTQRRWSRAEEDRIVRLIGLCQDAKQLKQIHAHLVVKGQSQNNFLLTKLVRSMTKLGYLEQARSLFDSIKHPSLFLWTAMIRAYSQQQDFQSCRKALFLYAQMHRSRFHVDDLTPLTFAMSSVLKACIQLSALEPIGLLLINGRQIHAHVIKYGLHFETNVQTTLINLYSQCKCLEDMQKIFERMPASQRDVQIWNTTIAGYAKNTDMEAALSLFHQMPERNLHTWVEMISGYANVGQMDKARILFNELKGSPIYVNERNQNFSIVLLTAMVTGYGVCGDIASAWLLFDGMTQRDVASWNSMLAAYSHAGMFHEVLDLFRLMLKNPEVVAGKVQPNQTTMAIVISACSQSGSADLAQWIEDYVCQFELVNKHTTTALIEMHSKFGDLDKAYEVFEQWKARDVICYSAMIEGFAIHGRGVEALQIFSQLLNAGLKPDGICFIAVLSACAHSGLVDEGFEYFKSMRDDFHILPTADHFMCMVDLLGRAGRIEEAYKLITDVMPPLKPHAGVWGALLSACRTHSNVQMGEVAAHHLLELEPENTGNYVLLSNLYAKARRWEDVGKVRNLMTEFGMKKFPGCSW